MHRVAAFGALALALTAAKSDPLAGRVAGAPARCIDMNRIDGPEIVDAHTILYHDMGKRLWRTGPVDACPALRPLTTLIVEAYGNGICRNDRFRVIDTGQSIPSAYCRFDAFIPYDKPAR